MKSYGYILSFLCAAGCMANNALEYEAVSENNLYHIAKIRKGMSEKQIMQIMGKPYDYESFQIEDDIYDVWFYVTKPTGLDQTRMVPQNLTPITFKNGIFVGTGYYWYYFAMKEQARDAAAKETAPLQKKEELQNSGEDLNLEKALKESTKPVSPIIPVKPSVQTPKNTSSAEPPLKAPQLEPISQKPAQSMKLNQLGMFAAVHVEQLSKVKLGMSETEVKRILGKDLNQETIQIGEDQYRILFYEISSKLNQPAQVVPFTFKNGLLVDMTEEYYEQIKAKSVPPKKAEEEVHGYNKEDDRMEEDASEQNFNFW
jgi:outer membrane protein assembly factor BamE (lipoprotein component of BamABCDE complex)